ncbi:hypothetical protein VP01_2695g5 [Puccinia sorghi]|uniref:Myb/SANT-like domain-containing protein n=1 Tax=Puccinia sorghi TaxID=27349 RepID=A0A0L6V4H8_9BASI|nr:hypothetical protein VP01_2695g5 [Puccinia sorghi]
MPGMLGRFRHNSQFMPNLGFKADVHRHVAQKLNEESRVATSLKRSYLCFIQFASQTFKKEYGTFLACRNAGGFGWDEVRCEVTASNEVWDQFLIAS